MVKKYIQQLRSFWYTSPEHPINLILHPQLNLMPIISGLLPCLFSPCSGFYFWGYSDKVSLSSAWNIIYQNCCRGSKRLMCSLDIDQSPSSNQCIQSGSLSFIGESFCILFLSFLTSLLSFLSSVVWMECLFCYVLVFLFLLWQFSWPLNLITTNSTSLSI